MENYINKDPLQLSKMTEKPIKNRVLGLGY